MKKKFVTLQTDIKDCGACCISSIVKYYDGYVPLEKIKEDCCISKNGITAYNIIETLKLYGFSAYGIKDKIEKDLPYPIIAHMLYDNGLYHFIVIYEYKKNYLLVMDPAKGMIKLPINEFLRYYTNFMIVATPIMNILKKEKSSSLKKFFYSFLYEEKNLIIKTILIGILLNIFLIISSYYTKVMINSIENNHLLTTCIIVGIFLVLTLYKIIFEMLKNDNITYLSKNLDIKINLPFIYHLYKLPLNSLANKSDGELLKRIEELNGIKELFTELFITFTIYFFQFIISFIFLFLINKTLCLLLIVVFILYIIISLFFNSTIIEKIRENINKETIYNKSLVDYTSKINTIKNINSYDYIFNNIEKDYIDYLNNTFLFNKFINIVEFIKNFIVEIGLFFINTIAFILLINNKITLVNIITFDAIIIYFQEPIKTFLNLLTKFNFIKNTFNKISEFIDLEEEKEEGNTTFINGDIKIKNIEFSYNHYAFQFQDYNLSIKQGSKLLIKGDSGSGKSTLCKLIYRLYDISKGSIEINNVPIDSYSIKTIRDNITYISQDEELFDGTLLENITLNKEYPIDHIYEILEICEIKDTIINLPLKLNTQVLDGGINFSGGQRQRIILARALLKNSAIIILDEALSQVDYKSELKIIKNLIKKYKSNTLIYVSHKDVDKLFKKIEVI